MTQRSNPALSKPVGGKSLPGLHYEIGRARSAFHQGPKLCASRKAEYIGADRLVAFIFRLRESGGPYIPLVRNLGVVEGMSDLE